MAFNIINSLSYSLNIKKGITIPPTPPPPFHLELLLGHNLILQLAHLL